MFKAIIFDMGEVLVKTFDRSHRTRLASRFNLSFEELEKIVYFSDSAVSAMSGEISEDEHFRYVLKVIGASYLKIHEFQEDFWGGDDIDKEMIDFISALKKQYKLGLLSNAMDSTRQRLNDKYNLLAYFDAGIFSCEVRMAKPSPEIYKLLLNQLHVKPIESIFIDDNIDNLEAAQKLGLTIVHAITTQQTIDSITQLLELNLSS